MPEDAAFRVSFVTIMDDDVFDLLEKRCLSVVLTERGGGEVV
jgi:hypothetical protein